MNNLKTILTILIKFLNSPEELFWAEDFMETISQASVYRLLEVLRELEIINKYKTTYYLNNRILQNATYTKSILPYIGKQAKRETMLYIIRYLLCDYNSTHSEGELQILFNRPKMDIRAILKLLIENKIITELEVKKGKKKPVKLYKLNADLAKKLTAKASVIQFHKNKLEVRP